MYYIFQDCDAFFTMCTTFVTFILSFFNATVFQRWWRLRELCGTINGRTVDTVVVLSTYIHKEEELGELMRYLWLAHALHIYSIQSGDLTTEEELLERLQQDGLLTHDDEVEALRICSSFQSSTPLSVAYGWFTSRLYKDLRYIPTSCHAPLLQLCQTNVSAMRGAAGDVLMYLNTPVPLAYVHLLELTVTIYVVMAPIGLVPRLLWMSIPGERTPTYSQPHSQPQLSTPLSNPALKPILKPSSQPHPQTQLSTPPNHPSSRRLHRDSRVLRLHVARQDDAQPVRQPERRRLRRAGLPEGHAQRLPRGGHCRLPCRGSTRAPAAKLPRSLTRGLTALVTERIDGGVQYSARGERLRGEHAGEPLPDSDGEAAPGSPTPQWRSTRGGLFGDGAG